MGFNPIPTYKNMYLFCTFQMDDWEKEKKELIIFLIQIKLSEYGWKYIIKQILFMVLWDTQNIW